MSLISGKVIPEWDKIIRRLEIPSWVSSEKSSWKYIKFSTYVLVSYRLSKINVSLI